MTMWTIVLIASALSFATKFTGYLVPARLLEHPTATRVANLLTVAMLAALVAVQSLAVGSAIEVDARIPAVMVAAVLFAIRAPFIVAVMAAGAVAALLRLLGWAG
ncbi:MAG: AzlD domain-containing protein [Actinobacteria bacterium]|nr:AzlD domain-containing protein [Actinomycetota bacterium]